jgi:hypothetical protein
MVLKNLNRPLRSRLKVLQGKTFESRVNCFQKDRFTPAGVHYTIPNGISIHSRRSFQQTDPDRDRPDFLSAVNPTEKIFFLGDLRALSEANG